MTATKLFPSGAWEVSDVVNGYLIRHRYYGLNKREAVRTFRAWLRNDILKKAVA